MMAIQQTLLFIRNMKVYDIKNSKPSEAYSAISGLNNFLSLFGLSRVYKDKGVLQYNSSLYKISILIIILLIANIYTVYDKVKNCESVKIDFDEIYQMGFLLGYIQYIIDTVFVYRYGRQPAIMYFVTYDYIDRIIGMTYYKNIRKHFGIICSFFIITISVTLIIQYLAYTTSFEWTLSLIFIVDYIYLGIRVLGGIDVTLNVVQVIYRLRTIGDLLENYYKIDIDVDMYRNIASEIWTTDERKKLSNIKVLSYSRHNIVLWLSRCYLFLNEQAEYINIMYGFRIIFNSTLYLIDMVFLINIIIRYIMGTTLVAGHNSSCLPVVSTLMRAMFETLALACGVYHAEATYREVDRIVLSIDRLVINKLTTKEIQESLKEFKRLILSRPINYHALHFYRLDYCTMVSMAATIVTYTIILLQNVQ